MKVLKFVCVIDLLGTLKPGSCDLIDFVFFKLKGPNKYSNKTGARRRQNMSYHQAPPFFDKNKSRVNKIYNVLII